MKKFLFNICLVSGLFLAMQSCQAQKVVLNREVETSTGEKMLLGDQSADQFKKEPYSTWYQPGYDTYIPDAEAMAKIKKEKINSYEIIIFLGTWCGDSHNNFPKMMKILDEAKYNTKKLKIVTVNRQKQSPTGEESLFNIQKVPTLIVKKYGKEIGRIIENPTSGFIEKDLVEILQKDNTNAVKDLFKK